MTSLGGGERGTDGLITRAQLYWFLSFVDEALVAFDDGGLITFASPALSTLTGYHPEMVVGHSLAEFLHPDDLERVGQLMEQWGGRRGSTAVPSVRVRVAAGEWLAVMVDAVSGPEVAPLGTFLVTLRKVGDSTEVEQQLRTRLANEARLVRLASCFVNLSADDLDDGVERALAEMSGLGGVDRVEVVLYDADLDEWVNSHEWAAANIPALRAQTPRIAHTDSPFLRAMRRNEEVSVASVANLGEEWAREKAWFSRRGVGSSIAVPLADQGHVVGFMGFEAVNREFVFAAGPPHHPAIGGRHPVAGAGPSVRGAAPRPPGPPRSTHRTSQPVGLPRGADAGAGQGRALDGGVGCGGPVVRPRPLQGGERLAGPWSRRPAVDHPGRARSTRPGPGHRCWPGWAATSWWSWSRSWRGSRRPSPWLGT